MVHSFVAYCRKKLCALFSLPFYFLLIFIFFSFSLSCGNLEPVWHTLYGHYYTASSDRHRSLSCSLSFYMLQWCLQQSNVLLVFGYLSRFPLSSFDRCRGNITELWIYHQSGTIGFHILYPNEIFNRIGVFNNNVAF